MCMYREQKVVGLNPTQGSSFSLKKGLFWGLLNCVPYVCAGIMLHVFFVVQNVINTRRLSHTTKIDCVSGVGSSLDEEGLHLSAIYCCHNQYALH